MQLLFPYHFNLADDTAIEVTLKGEDLYCFVVKPPYEQSPYRFEWDELAEFPQVFNDIQSHIISIFEEQLAGKELYEKLEH